MSDFNGAKLKRVVKQLVQTEFHEQRNFDIEIDGAPDDLSLYVKDISYGPVEVETDQGKTGMNVSTSPVSRQPVTVTITVRDKMEGGKFKVQKWFSDWAAKIWNADGTYNLPKPGTADSWVVKYRRFSVSDYGETREMTEEFDVVPTKLGDVSESRAEGGHVEYPITIVQYKSLS
jgi:hypothetical protein